MNPIASLVAGLVKPASSAYGKHVDKKIAQQTAQAKLRQAKIDNAHEVTLSQVELEVLARKNEAGTWKDEYALVLGSSPYLLLLIGSLLNAFGVEQFQQGVTDGLFAINEIGVPVGQICAASIAAGLGIKLLKR